MQTTLSSPAADQVSTPNRPDLLSSSRVYWLIFIASLLLSASIFFPNLREINPWDEAAYIQTGPGIWEGQLVNYGSSPLSSLFYALTYLPFAGSPYWLILSCTLGRVLLFGFLWLGAFLVARELRDELPPAVMAGLLLVTPLTMDMIRFPSDPLFAGFSALAFWQVLRFRRLGGWKPTAWASFFLGLAALSRNDGLLLVPALAVIAFFWSTSARGRLTALAAALAPFALLVGVYLGIFGLKTGDYSMGTMARTYDNFETGHGIVTDSADILENQLRAREVFGTPEENDFSIFKAIQRRPDIYAQRLLAVLKQLPETLNRAYGIHFALVLVFLAVRGALRLLLARQGSLLFWMLLWLAPLAGSLAVTLVRSGHLLFPFFLLFALAGIGLVQLVSDLAQPRERIVWTAVLVLTILATLATGKTALFYTAAVFLGGLWLVVLSGSFRQPSLAVPLLVFLIVGVILRGNFPGLKFRQLGQFADEQAVAYIQQALPRDAAVLAWAPGPVWATRRPYVGLYSHDRPRLNSKEEFLEWLKAEDIAAIYIDHSFEDPYLTWAQELKGQGLRQAFLGEEGDIQVLVPE